jgi:UDP:flavonoid glycosyltransferase YjiC (YdhE family)
MLAGMEEVWGDWVPDLVLREPTEYASAILAARTQTPIAQVAISLAETEAGSIATAAPALEEHGHGLVSGLRAQPYLTRFPASLDPSPFANTVRFHERSETPVSLPDWWRGSEAPLIYLTFGTVLGYMSIATETYRMALRSVERTSARVLLTVGRRFDATTLHPVPENVHVEAWVDQARALEHADLVVCHGGSGTALAALAAGVPLVMVPLFADHFENARRIAATGAGLVPIGDGPASSNHAAASQITASIEDVLGDVTYRDRARGIAAEMAATQTVEQVLTRLPSR